MSYRERSARQHWTMILVWVIAALICVIFLSQAKKPFVIGGISDPRAESSLAMDIMTNQLAYGGSRVFVLYQSSALTAQDPQFKSQVSKSLSGLDKFPIQHRIISPYQNSHAISPDQHAAYAIVIFKESPDEISTHMRQFHQDLGKPDSLKMYVGGQPSYIDDVNKLSEESLLRGEMIAFPLCLIVLVVVFRGFVAALLPIALGMINTAIILTLLYVIGAYLELSIFVLNVATILGLAFSLDYTLLISYRFREELFHHHTTSEAMRITRATAVKSIFYSGLAVMISMSSLLFFPVNVLFSIGMAGVVMIIVVVVSAMSLLPAILHLLGEKVNAWPVPFLSAAFSEKQESGFWYRIATIVMKRPVLFLVPTTLFLLFLGYPFLSVIPNRADSSILPASTESRQMLDVFAKYFNANELAPINIVLYSPQANILSYNNTGDLYDFAQRLLHDPRVANIVSAVTFDPKLNKFKYQDMYYFLARSSLDKDLQTYLHETTNAHYTVMSVISKYPVNDERTFDLVRAIRSMQASPYISHMVTGNSAIIIDTIKSVYAMFARLIIIICVITYVVLLFLLRSLALPLKAIIMNFLSLCVCYGMLVFIFQEGHFSWLLNFTAPGYTDFNLPILLFFSLFGISMDYEVFLLTRIKEVYEQTGDNTLSVSTGLQRCARIITSAALLVVIVTGSFVTANIIFVKAFGLGIALAVGIDATIIRMLLVPATMRLLGKWNWYLPRWLDRIMPKLEFH